MIRRIKKENLKGVEVKFRIDRIRRKKFHIKNEPISSNKKKSQTKFGTFGAKDEARTRDNQLGRLELYQLSYFRLSTVQI